MIYCVMLNIFETEKNSHGLFDGVQVPLIRLMKIGESTAYHSPDGVKRDCGMIEALK